MKVFYSMKWLFIIIILLIISPCYNTYYVKLKLPSYSSKLYNLQKSRTPPVSVHCHANNNVKQSLLQFKIDQKNIPSSLISSGVSNNKLINENIELEQQSQQTNGDHFRINLRMKKIKEEYDITHNQLKYISNLYTILQHIYDKQLKYIDIIESIMIIIAKIDISKQYNSIKNNNKNKNMKDKHSLNIQPTLNNTIKHIHTIQISTYKLYMKHNISTIQSNIFIKQYILYLYMYKSTISAQYCHKHMLEYNLANKNDFSTAELCYYIHTVYSSSGSNNKRQQNKRNYKAGRSQNSTAGSSSCSSSSSSSSSSTATAADVDKRINDSFDTLNNNNTTTINTNSTTTSTTATNSTTTATTIELYTKLNTWLNNIHNYNNIEIYSILYCLSKYNQIKLIFSIFNKIKERNLIIKSEYKELLLQALVKTINKNKKAISMSELPIADMYIPEVFFILFYYFYCYCFSFFYVICIYFNIVYIVVIIIYIYVCIQLYI